MDRFAERMSFNVEVIMTQHTPATNLQVAGWSTVLGGSTI
jgi:hypothetical protein